MAESRQDPGSRRAGSIPRGAARCARTSSKPATTELDASSITFRARSPSPAIHLGVAEAGLAAACRLDLGAFCSDAGLSRLELLKCRLHYCPHIALLKNYHNISSLSRIKLRRPATLQTAERRWYKFSECYNDLLRTIVLSAAVGTKPQNFDKGSPAF